MKKYECQYYKVNNDEMEIVVTIERVSTRKEIFAWLDDELDSLSGITDDVFEILYNDGTYEYINCEYDGHKIRRTGIVSMIFHNDCTDMIFGNFEMNEYGCTTVSGYMDICEEATRISEEEAHGYFNPTKAESTEEATTETSEKTNEADTITPAAILAEVEELETLEAIGTELDNALDAALDPYDAETVERLEAEWDEAYTKEWNQRQKVLTMLVEFSGGRLTHDDAKSVLGHREEFHGILKRGV